MEEVVTTKGRFLLPSEIPTEFVADSELLLFHLEKAAYNNKPGFEVTGNGLRFWYGEEGERISSAEMTAITNVSGYAKKLSFYYSGNYFNYLYIYLKTEDLPRQAVKVVLTPTRITIFAYKSFKIATQ